MSYYKIMVPHSVRSLAAIKRDCKRYAVNSLLAAPESNPKIYKSQKDNRVAETVITFPMHLAPADLSGFNICPYATAGCKAACLHTAGNPVYMANKEKARIARTQLFQKDRALFMELLAAEISAAFRKVARLNSTAKPGEKFKAAFRLNATSDLDWSKLGRKHPFFGFSPVTDFIADLGGVSYDYTKNPNPGNNSGNYHRTFSLAEDNDLQAGQAIDNGLNVAAVFNVRRGKPLPATYTIAGRTLPVIDGDISDYRPADSAGVIVGLRAKGDAIGDSSGFVRECY